MYARSQGMVNVATDKDAVMLFVVLYISAFAFVVLRSAARYTSGLHGVGDVPLKLS